MAGKNKYEGIKTLKKKRDQKKNGIKLAFTVQAKNLCMNYVITYI